MNKKLIKLIYICIFFWNVLFPISELLSLLQYISVTNWIHHLFAQLLIKWKQLNWVCWILVQSLLRPNHLQFVSSCVLNKCSIDVLVFEDSSLQFCNIVKFLLSVIGFCALESSMLFSLILNFRFKWTYFITLEHTQYLHKTNTCRYFLLCLKCYTYYLLLYKLSLRFVLAICYLKFKLLTEHHVNSS